MLISLNQVLTRHGLAHHANNFSANIEEFLKKNNIKLEAEPNSSANNQNIGTSQSPRTIGQQNQNIYDLQILISEKQLERKEYK